jgi:hypothetical protein
MKHIVAAAVAVAVLALPGAVLGSGATKVEQDKTAKVERKAAKPVSFVFKGVYKGAGVVTVSKGNKHVRRAGFVGTDVTFDLAGAKVVAEGEPQAGDKVVVKARLPRGTKAPATAPIAARQLVDQTHPPASEAGEDDE